MKLFLTTLCFLFLSASAASACDCMMPPSPLEALAVSDAVFQGVVLSIITPPNLFDPMSITFQVIGGWKGVYEGTVVIRTGSIINSCHYPFALGAEYLVYASDPDGGILNLYTSLCSRTCPIALAAEDLNALGGTIAADTSAWGTVKAYFR